MAIKDKLSKWLDDEQAKEAPERHKLASRLAKDADDEETAGLLNKLLDKVLGGGKDGK